MDRCPLEIWPEIAAFACTDGGRTACALSLVSHRMHAVVQPVRYFSVSLTSKRQVLAFAARVAAMDKPPVILHLFVSCADEQDPHSSSIDLELILAQRRMGLLSKWQTPDDSPTKHPGQLAAAIHSIFVSAAPHLHTLVELVDTAVALELETLAHPRFPHLRALTSSYMADRLPASDPGHARFPALRRLHVTRAHSSAPFWLALAQAAPRATHLRLSGLAESTHAEPFLRALLAAPSNSAPRDIALGELRLPCAWEDHTPFATDVAARLPALAYVCVAPGRCRTAAGAGEHARMRAMLKGLSAQFRGSEARTFVILSEAQKVYSFEETYKDWVDIVEGREGVWQIR
ncbi:hypothetical protein PsYK624_158920 [Phanerochaete sordida]|uniref:Uncharacterized protein n=1 Tax=Phanerochaete sordida TaxID=48140 RepID=A0A9P3GR49_9APHY|nr:hypothetical protein PsYK624_158920 [Phanerochaete sordida]